MPSQVVSGVQASSSHKAGAPASPGESCGRAAETAARMVDELKLPRVEVRPKRLELLRLIQPYDAGLQTTWRVRRESRRREGKRRHQRYEDRPHRAAHLAM